MHDARALRGLGGGEKLLSFFASCHFLLTFLRADLLAHAWGSNRMLFMRLVILRG